jgi:hypothetical protein
MATQANDLNIRLATASDRFSWDTYVLRHPIGMAYQLFAGFKSKLRNKIKLSTRDEFSARMGSGELLLDFYHIFRDNMRDLGSPVHSWQWFQAIVDSYEDRVRIAIVYASDGKPAAARIILLHPKTTANPWASSLRWYDR